MEEKYLGDKNTIKQIETVLTSAQPYKEQIVELIQSNKPDEAMQVFNESYAPLSVQARTALDKLGQEASGRATQRFQDGQGATNSAFFLLVVISLIGLLLMVVFCVYITRAMTRPIQEIKSAAEELEKGNLDAEISYQSKDELGVLSESMRNTIHTLKGYITEISRVLRELSEGNLRVSTEIEFNGSFSELEHNIESAVAKINDTLNQINQSSEQVTVGAEQVSDGAQTLSQGATEQAGTLQELAATVSEISRRVDHNAKNAAESSAQADAVGVQLMESNEKMRQLIDAMSQISSSSNEIGKINKTIEDIAFQTNILALNAAVEAARAGAAGKGFAVVADEVRNLAAKSAEASKTTEQLIRNALMQVQNGVQIADNTAQSLHAVVENLQSNIQSIDEIAQASQEQSQAIEQVTVGIDQISAVVQMNSATAEESAAASEELSGQSRLLKELVGYFRLNDSLDY